MSFKLIQFPFLLVSLCLLYHFLYEDSFSGKMSKDILVCFFYVLLQYVPITLSMPLPKPWREHRDATRALVGMYSGEMRVLFEHQKANSNSCFSNRKYSLASFVPFLILILCAKAFSTMTCLL